MRNIKRRVIPSRSSPPVSAPMPSITTMPVRPPVMTPSMTMAPSADAPKSSWDKFRSWLKSNQIISGSLSKLSRLEILNKYKDVLSTAAVAAGAIGYGKRKGKSKMIRHHEKLLKYIHQRGGSWGDFTSWVRGAANTVANKVTDTANRVAKTASSVYNRAIRPAGEFIYNRGLRPGYDYAKNKPLTTLGAAAKGLSYIPSPFSGALSTAGTALGVAGTLSGKGMSGGSRNNAYGKTLMVFN